MNLKDFNKLIDCRCKKIKDVLVSKSAEYSTDDDKFHNFKVAARYLNTTQEKALMGMKVKHTVSIDDLVEHADTEPERLTEHLINEKIGDEINYLILLEGMLLEKISVQQKKRREKH